MFNFRNRFVLFAWIRQVKDNWNDYPLAEGMLVCGRYRIVSPLGMGSYGLTYKVEDIRTGEFRLLKHDRPSKGSLSKRLLEREAAWLERFDHPQIPKKLDMFESGRKTFLVTEFVAGLTAEQLVFEEGRTWSEREALFVLKQLAELVLYIHERGVVHRDIRLPNVLFVDGTAHLIDFGLACGIGEEEPIMDKMSGIPEPRRADRSDIGCDFVDIGDIVLYLLYAGYRPEPDQEDRGWERELSLTPGTKQLLRRLLETDRPFANAGELLGRLEAVLDELPPGNLPSS